mgnify:CR=1 FL=1
MVMMKYIIIWLKLFTLKPLINMNVLETANILLDYYTPDIVESEIIINNNKSQETVIDGKIIKSFVSKCISTEP